MEFLRYSNGTYFKVRCSHQSMFKIPIAACLILRENKLLVLFHRERGYYVLPGGKLEPGECFEDAAIRETEEEAGVKVKLGKSMGEHEFVKDGKTYHGCAFSVKQENTE